MGCDRRQPKQELTKLAEAGVRVRFAAAVHQWRRSRGRRLGTPQAGQESGALSAGFLEPPRWKREASIASQNAGCGMPRSGPRSVRIEKSGRRLRPPTEATTTVLHAVSGVPHLPSSRGDRRKPPCAEHSGFAPDCAGRKFVPYPVRPRSRPWGPLRRFGRLVRVNPEASTGCLASFAILLWTQSRFPARKRR